MASRTDLFIEGKFSSRVNSKDGFVVSDCKDGRSRRVLEFLVPLLYPEKPTLVTIFGALSRERPIDWRAVLKDVVQRLYSGMEKSKATPLCPYIFYLYHIDECLLQVKKKDYRMALGL